HVASGQNVIQLHLLSRCHSVERQGEKIRPNIKLVLGALIEHHISHFENFNEDELYVWPYFFALPFDKMTPAQKVELYHVLTAGDVQDSIGFGSYIFYRVGIKPDGTWQFFVAGD
ncbi:MAG: hypothetical protein AAFO68_07210, partial [Pseudomonadota bacterium]